ncbi:hypothetical protein [Streptomyces sp. BH105]|uniref:hypothetical protein n=1 Tax=Streptomyces sp. BH105 TaxID=3410408 RepID=UPI003CF5671C
MRSTPRVTTTLATYLFVSQAHTSEFAANPARTNELIQQTAERLGPNGAALARDEVATEYGRHPETAAAHMQVCLQAVEAARIEIPVPGQRTAVTR